MALLETYVAKENPPTRLHRDFRASPENCGDEDCHSTLPRYHGRAGHCSTGWGKGGAFRIGIEIPIETFDPEGREKFTTWPICSRLLPSLTVHCRARSRQLRSPIVVMALATLATRQPCRTRPGDFRYVTCKTGETTSPHGDIAMHLSQASSTIPVYRAACATCACQLLEY